MHADNEGSGECW